MISNKELVAKAIQARDNANAKHSNFYVGAAGVTQDGEIITGANMESSSYGLTLCAERLLLFKAAELGKRIVKLAIVGDTTQPIVPCGACRQIMVEYMDSNAEVVLANMAGEIKEATVGELMPHSFTDDQLTK